MKSMQCSLFHFVQQSDDELTIEVKRSGLLHASETLKLLRNLDLGDYISTLSNVMLILYMDNMKEFVIKCGTRLLHFIGY